MSSGAARVLVAGAGHAGLLLALALDRAGIATTLIDPQAPSDVLGAPFDGRALALMYGSRRVFDGLDLWAAVAPAATPVVGVRVHDGASGAGIAYDAADVGDHPFAYGIENRLLRARLLELARDCPGIELAQPAALQGIERRSEHVVAGLDDGSRREVSLIVGADGRGSTVRRLAGIGTDRRACKQTAITFAIRHERPHDQLVREFLRPAGPLALLPIGDELCSITWIEGTDTADVLLAGTRDALRVALLERIGDVLGDFDITGAPAGYPLSIHHARRYVAPRTALLGDAAHGAHPIHAQGFNLGVRDVATLAETLADADRAGGDLGDAAMLIGYERRRRGDVTQTLGMTEGLNRLFSNDFPPAKVARGLGLAALDRVRPLKRLAMRRGMGLAGDLPRLARGEAL